MAKKIFKGIGSLLGIGKKKKAEPAPAAEQKGPIITPLGGAPAPDPRRRRVGTKRGLVEPTILSDKLGN